LGNKVLKYNKMEISITLVKSVANLFTIDELQQKIQEATLQMLANPDAIVSASTGSGASYSKVINMRAQDIVELFTYALEYKQTGTLSAGGSNIMHSLTFII
jgi:hypothetical protein